MSTRIALVHGTGRRFQDWDAVVPGLADLGEVVAAVRQQVLARPGTRS